MACFVSVSVTAWSYKTEGTGRKTLPVQQGHQHVRVGVCLPKHGDRRLGQYPVTHELRHFRRHVNIRNAGFGGLQVFGLDGKIGHGIFQSVLHGSEVGAHVVLFDDGVVYASQSLAW